MIGYEIIYIVLQLAKILGVDILGVDILGGCLKVGRGTRNAKWGNV